METIKVWFLPTLNIFVIKVDEGLTVLFITSMNKWVKLCLDNLNLVSVIELHGAAIG